MLQVGIIGLPNVGKSTLFNAITKSKVLAANYPFATIEPNVGVVPVQDSRLNFIAKHYNPLRVINTTIKFTDIAGLVKGASSGEGLGNKFLSHIREVNAICHVVRCFDSKKITHVHGDVDPIRDFETVDMELKLSDLERLENRIKNLDQKKKKNPKESLLELSILNNIKKGNLATLNCPEEVYLAKILIKHHPWSSLVKFTRGGGEANALAIRIARSNTRKKNVAFCGYHGWHAIRDNHKRQHFFFEYLILLF